MERDFSKHYHKLHAMQISFESLDALCEIGLNTAQIGDIVLGLAKLIKEGKEPKFDDVLTDVRYRIVKKFTLEKADSHIAGHWNFYDSAKNPASRNNGLQLNPNENPL